MPSRLPIDAIPTLPTVLSTIRSRDAQADGMADLIIAMSGGRRPARA